MPSAPAADREMFNFALCDNGIFIAPNDEFRSRLSVKKVECTYASSGTKVFWLVFLINQDEQIFAKYMLPDDNDVPLFVRQLLVLKYHAMLFGQHAHGTYCNNCICNNCICNTCYNRDYANVQLLHAKGPSENILSAKADDRQRNLFSKVIASLHAHPANASRLAFMAALHWRNFVKKNVARRRAQARTELLREDLNAAT